MRLFRAISVSPDYPLSGIPIPIICFNLLDETKLQEGAKNSGFVDLSYCVENIVIGNANVNVSAHFKNLTWKRRKS